MKRRNCLIPRLFLVCNKVKFGKKLKLHGCPFIFRYPHSIVEIGDRCTINSSFLSNMIGLYQRSIIVARGGHIFIGNNVGLSGSTIYARREITIGDNTIIGANTKIFDNDFHSLDASERVSNEFNNLKCQPVHIGKNVFIGCNCIILKGTVIGDNCIVGAGAVVHGVYPDNCRIVGNPSKCYSLGKKMENG